MKEEFLFLFLPKFAGVIATPSCTLVSYGPAGSACATSKISWSRGWWFSAGPQDALKILGGNCSNLRLFKGEGFASILSKNLGGRSPLRPCSAVYCMFLLKIDFQYCQKQEQPIIKSCEITASRTTFSYLTEVFFGIIAQNFSTMQFQIKSFITSFFLLTQIN